MGSVWFGNLLAYTNLLPTLSNLGYKLKKGTNLILESNAAFNRSIYPLHQELEFTLPYEGTLTPCFHFIKLYEKLFAIGLPYTVIEIRFTPAGHNRTLIGPGLERHSIWVDVVCNDSTGFKTFYKTVEAEIKQSNARPHLGKFCEIFDKKDLAQRYQENFSHFYQLKKEHDPEGKFVNPFTQKLFGI